MLKALDNLSVRPLEAINLIRGLLESMHILFLCLNKRCRSNGNR